MNDVIKPYFEQLIEDREYTHSTGPAPREIVKSYIEALERLVEDAYDGFVVELEQKIVN